MLFRPWIAVAVGVLTAIALSSAARAGSPPPVTDACPEVLNYSFNHLQTGKPESLCQYRGKVVLIVNTASYCGYTHQYEGLEALYRKYKSRGLVVVGFPSNDFGGQEPGSNKDIAEFCRLTYGVEFPMFEKSSVTSIKTNPLYAELLGGRGRVPNGTFTNILSIATASKSRASGPKSSPITANSSALSSGCWPPNRQFPKVDAR